MINSFVRHVTSRQELRESLQHETLCNPAVLHLSHSFSLTVDFPERSSCVNRMKTARCSCTFACSGWGHAGNKKKRNRTRSPRFLSFHQLTARATQAPSKRRCCWLTAGRTPSQISRLLPALKPSSLHPQLLTFTSAPHLYFWDFSQWSSLKTKRTFLFSSKKYSAGIYCLYNRLS